MIQDRHGKQPARPNISPKRSTESVLIVKENRLAHNTLDRLAQADRDSSPGLVYLYGPSGVGKSHLVRQFVREAQRRNPKLRLRNTTASEFDATWGHAHARQEQAEIEAEYASLDLLIIEDLGGMQGRAATQRALVVILDELKRSGGRTIVTCTSLPGQLKNVIPRLASRLRGGVCIPMDLLDESSRVSFAKHFAAGRQIPLAPETAELLARTGPATPRELLAALVNLEFGARRKASHTAPTPAEAHLGAGSKSTHQSLGLIAKIVAKFYSVPVSQLRSSARLKRSVPARQVAMLLARELSGKSAAVIAKYFGRKNHTTVVHACRRTRALVAADPSLAHEIERLRRTIRRSTP